MLSRLSQARVGSREGVLLLLGFISQKIHVEHILRTQWDLSLYCIEAYFIIAKSKSDKVVIVPFLFGNCFQRRCWGDPKTEYWCCKRNQGWDRGLW